jgi:hypothetical protein
MKEETFESLKEENEKLKNSLFELTTQINYSIEIELAELIRNIYSGINIELNCPNEDLTKKEILYNLKDNIEMFAKDYKFAL